VSAEEYDALVNRAGGLRIAEEPSYGCRRDPDEVSALDFGCGRSRAPYRPGKVGPHARVPLGGDNRESIVDGHYRPKPGKTTGGERSKSPEGDYQRRGKHSEPFLSVDRETGTRHPKRKATNSSPLKSQAVSTSSPPSPVFSYVEVSHSDCDIECDVPLVRKQPVSPLQEGIHWHDAPPPYLLSKPPRPPRVIDSPWFLKQGTGTARFDSDKETASLPGSSNSSLTLVDSPGYRAACPPSTSHVALNHSTPAGYFAHPAPGYAQPVRVQQGAHYHHPPIAQPDLPCQWCTATKGCVIHYYPVVPPGHAPPPFIPLCTEALNYPVIPEIEALRDGAMSMKRRK